MLKLVHNTILQTMAQTLMMLNHQYTASLQEAI